MVLRELLGAIRADLNDVNPAGTLQGRWSEEQLLRYFNEGLCQAFSIRPEDYIEQVLVQLEPGSVQKLCDCKHLHKIIGQTDATGLVVKSVEESNEVIDAIASRWKKRKCPNTSSGTQAYRMQSYKLNVADNGFFTVVPAVPPNEEVYIKALCSNPPEPYSLSDMDREVDDCQMVTAARQWALHAALMVDDESEASLSAARMHLETFFNILKVQKDAALAFKMSGQLGKAQR